MWTYDQLTGNLTNSAGELAAKAYSGQPPHTNDPSAEGEVGIGPIPRGGWTITGVEMETAAHGPYVLVLSPDITTRARVITLGRDPDSFRIHGERLVPPPGYASDGCIVVSRDVREAIWASNDLNLVVT
jgi:hypothetical protein